MELLDVMIQTRRLEEFLRELFNIRKEEMDDKCAWEVWLHKVLNMDWSEYYAAWHDKSSTTEAAPPQEKLKETVRASAQMLMNFCPYGGGKDDGTVQIDGNDSG